MSAGKNVLILSPGADTGGQGYRIAQAINRYLDGWKATAMHVTPSYMHYPHDVRWDRDLAKRLYDEADVVHHKQRLELYQLLDRGQRKPTVIHHQGTRLRSNPGPVFNEGLSIGAKHIVSTLDLLRCVRGGTWLPSPFDLSTFAPYARPGRGPIVISHAPTDRNVKGTEHLIRAVETLRRFYDVELDIIENVSWKVCLSRKGQSHIYVDQLELGYGNNAIEAWAMGIPVVCGVQYPGARDRMLKTFGGELPFYEATEETLTTALEDMIRSAELRAEYADRGRAHFAEWHEESGVAERLRKVYNKARPSLGVEHLEMAPRIVIKPRKRREIREAANAYA